MPQIVLSDTEFDTIKNILEEFIDCDHPHEEVIDLLGRFNSVKLCYESTREDVMRAKKHTKHSPFSIDFDAEVSAVDAQCSWVNGWYLVRGETL